MLYRAYDAGRVYRAPLMGAAALGSAAVSHLPGHLARTRPARTLRAASETVSALRLTHSRPPFGVDSVRIGERDVPVVEEVVAATPFGSLVRFVKDADVEQPKVLMVPGLAGHFASLVRETVRTMLVDHDVYVADWHNARDVPRDAGRFGLDEYVEHLMDFLGEIGPGTHLMAICQPCVAALAAASIMTADGNPAAPASLILMAGPVDTRVNPGRINRYAERQSLALMERTLVTRVPRWYRGHGRRVYPGFLQVSGFMSMDPRRHAAAFAGMFSDIAGGRDEEAARTSAFYDEYFAVIDVTAEFFLDTARVVFMDHDLPRGRMLWRGRTVDPSLIDSALLTIEGANDGMCCPGQTEAAHALCTGIADEDHEHLLQEGVGHYGVFSGTRFREEIAPRITSFVAAHDATRLAAAGSRAA